MNDLEDRLNNLEIKFSYQDELINELNLIVANQQSKIDKMEEMLKQIHEQSSEDGSQNTSLENERPPHY